MKQQCPIAPMSNSLGALKLSKTGSKTGFVIVAVVSFSSFCFVSIMALYPIDLLVLSFLAVHISKDQKVFLISPLHTLK